MRNQLPLVVLGLALGCKGTPAKQQTPAESPAPGSAATDAAAVADAAGDAVAVEPVRLEHAVWKLVDNRHTAHRYVDDELVLDARSIGFARYHRFGGTEPQWQRGDVAGERAVIADKLAGLSIPVIAEQPAPSQLTARVYAEDKQSLEVSINGKRGRKRAPLEAGWQIVALPVDPGAFIAGENVIALKTIGKAKRGVALAWLRAGTTHPPADQDPLAAATFDAGADAIELVSGAALAWYVQVPEGAHLVAEVGSPCLVDVGARASDGTFAGGLLASDQDRVDLSALAGKAVRLVLEPRDCPRARIGHPRITVHGPEPARLQAVDPPRFVLLWKVASLRSDPGFDELARASTVFRQFTWVDVDRAELGKAIAAQAKLQAVLVANATVDSLLEHFDRARERSAAPSGQQPFFMFVDTSREPKPQLQRVIAQLKAWGFWDQTLVIVADARELAIHDPARYPNGTVVEEGVEASDIVPSVLDALGQPFDGSAGAPLAALAQGVGRGWARPTYTELAGGTHVLRLGRWTIRTVGTAVTLIGDVADDPGGTVDLASVKPVERRLLTDSLGLLLALRGQWNKAEWGVVSNLSSAGARALDEVRVQ